MGYTKRIRSNLIGISQDSAVYRITRERIVRRLNTGLDSDKSERIKSVATDIYFLFYSQHGYITQNRNSDEFMENMRNSMANLSMSDDFITARSYSKLNDRLSMLYSINFMKGLNDRIKKNNMNNPNPDKAIEPKMIDESMECAAKKMETAREIEKILKHNKNGGKMPNNEEMSIEALINLTDRVLEVDNADKILSMANKLIDAMPKFTKQMETYSINGELAGYVKTLHISNVLSRELAMPDELFYSRIASGFTGKEKMLKSSGAYYILLDKSGSMYEGDKTLWSRSVALALFRIAELKKRKYFFRFFDNKPHELLETPYDIMNGLLTVEANKGTCIECALKTALNDLQEGNMMKQTNTIIIITDGEDRVNMKDYFKKDGNVKLITVMINGHNEGLKRASMEYINASLNEEGALQLLGLAKSF
ncbi:MAG: VWA domain-containing protein [Ferroplasma sp.]